MYMLVDWTGNILANGKCFENSDEAFDFMYENFDAEDIEDIQIELREDIEKKQYQAPSKEVIFTRTFAGCYA